MNKLEKLRIETELCRTEVNKISADELAQPIGVTRNGRLKVLEQQRKILDVTAELIAQGIEIEASENIDRVRQIIRELLTLEGVPPSDPTPEDLAHSDTDPDNIK